MESLHYIAISVDTHFPPHIVEYLQLNFSIVSASTLHTCFDLFIFLYSRNILQFSRASPQPQAIAVLAHVLYGLYDFSREIFMAFSRCIAPHRVLSNNKAETVSVPVD